MSVEEATVKEQIQTRYRLGKLTYFSQVDNFNATLGALSFSPASPLDGQASGLQIL